MRTLILDSQITISSLGSCTPLHMKGVSQLNKWARGLKWTSRGCIYTSLSQSQPLCANSTFSYWPDVPVDVTGRVRSVATVDFEIKGAEWTDAQTSPIKGAFGRSKPSLETLCFFFTVDQTHRIRVRLVVHRVWSQTLAMLTANSATCASDHELTSVRSNKQFAAVVQYTDRMRPVKRKGPCPVKLKGHKLLRITTRLERNLFQMIFGLYLSYLVLSSISVHHT
jgi:hypothetical protein